MKYNWKKYTLNDVCSRIYSGGTPSTRNPEYWNGNFNWLSSGETSQRFIYNTERTITQKGIDNSSTKLAKKGCTVVATAGQGYTRGQVSFLMIDTYMNQSVIACESNPKYILPLYLYYNLDNRYEEFRLLSDGTSTRGGLSGWILKRMEIDLPPLDIQKKIVSILKPIDDKIELNRAVNENLQEQAQAIYENLINNLENNGIIGDYCSIKSGFAFKNSWWEKSGIKVIKISSDKINKISPIFKLKGGDLVIALTGATLGKFAIVPEIREIVFVNQRVGKFLLGDEPLEKLPYIYCLLKQNRIYDELLNRSNGTAQSNISPFDIMSIPCVILEESVIKKFNLKTKAMFELIINNQLQNKQLAELRDTLLPRLMSGKLDVSNVELKFKF